MIKYAFKEFVRNIYSNIFISVQLAVTLIVAIASVSSVLSRTEFYSPVEKFINDSNGYFISHVSDSIALNSYLEEINEFETTYSALGTNIFFSINNKNKLTEIDEKCKYAFALPDLYIDAYTPDMKSGVWLNDYTLNDEDELFAVVTENDYYETGDILTAAYKHRTGKMSPDDENYDEYDPYTYEYLQFKIKIAGVIADESKILGFSQDMYTNDGEVNNEPDFRDLYTTVNKYENFLLIMPEKILNNTGCLVYPDGNRIVKLKNGTSSDRYVEIERLLRQFGIVDSMEEFRNNTTRYINEQLIKLIPLLICTVILVIVSSVSISALNAKKRIKYFGILYICGSQWKNCLVINLINSFITAFMSGIFTYAAINVLKITGMLKATVISMGLWQFIVCLVIVLLYILCSIIMPIGIMTRNTPKEILASNE